MNVLWWQGGVHIEPENEREREALKTLVESLHLIESRQQVVPGPVGTIDRHHQDAVVAVHELPQPIPDLGGGAVDASRPL